MSSPMKMEVMRAVDMIIQIFPVLIAFAWFLASIYEIVVGGSFATTPLGLPFIGRFTVSSVTVMLYTSFYLYTFYQLDYLLAPVRVVVTLSMTVLGMAFTSLTFSTTLTSAIIHFSIFFIVCTVLLSYNRKNRFFQFPFSFVVLVIYYALTRIFLNKAAPHDYSSRFVIYTIVKYFGVWIWSDLYQKRSGLKYKKLTSVRRSLNDSRVGGCKA